MKTIILTSLLFILTNVSAQEFKYLEVEVRGGDNVYVDDGSGLEAGGFGNAKRAKKDNGEPFKGNVDVLVYFESKGWELYKWNATALASVSYRVYLFRVIGSESNIPQMLSNYPDTAQVKPPDIVKRF
jgi:hypothetical protein